VTPDRDARWLSPRANKECIRALKLLLTKASRLNGSWNCRGDDVRGPIAFAALIACAALCPTQGAASERPARMIAPARGAPSTAVRAARSRPAQSRLAPSIVAPRRQSALAIPERRKIFEVEGNGGHPIPGVPKPTGGHIIDAPAEIDITVNTEDDSCEKTETALDTGAFLLPVRHHGFWAMPPGGLTRYIWAPPGFINPDQILPQY